MLIRKSAPVLSAWGMNDDDDESASFIVTTEQPDRDGDIIRTAGLDWSKWRKNPIVLLNHNPAVPVGTSRDPETGNISLSVGRDSATATCWFHGETTEAKQVKALVARQILNGASIGMLVMKSRPLGYKGLTGRQAVEVTSAQVTEWSVCAMPVCRECTRCESLDCVPNLTPGLRKCLGFDTCVCGGCGLTYQRALRLESIEAGVTALSSGVKNLAYGGPMGRLARLEQGVTNIERHAYALIGQTPPVRRLAVSAAASAAQLERIDKLTREVEKNRYHLLGK